jgi:hypothetical protein
MKRIGWEVAWGLEMQKAFPEVKPYERWWCAPVGNRLTEYQKRIRESSVGARRTSRAHSIHKRAMMRAAQIVCRAIKRGDLPHLTDSIVTCVDCKVRRATNYEHRDYAKPLEVDPVCRTCNVLRGPAQISRPVPTNPNKARQVRRAVIGHRRQAI